ncbi:MAG: S24/S26 family peptidase [Planctomycetota bacterium]|jgi:signal peptidase
MVPVLLPGDRLKWQATTARELRFGEIILYLRGTSIIAHRFLYRRRKSGSTFMICKGDALMSRDAPVPEDALLGRVTRVVRNGNSRNISYITNLAATAKMIAKWLVKRAVSARRT